MKEDKLRIEAHKKAYDDLVQWIMHQFKTEIIYLLPSAKISVNEWYSKIQKDLIQGASVVIEIKDWFDSATIDYLCHVLGTKEYRVTAFPLCRMHLTFKVANANVSKTAMQCTGMWTPIWRKKDEQKNK